MFIDLGDNSVGICLCFTASSPEGFGATNSSTAYGDGTKTQFAESPNKKETGNLPSGHRDRSHNLRA